MKKLFRFNNYLTLLLLLLDIRQQLKDRATEKDAKNGQVKIKT